MVKFHIPGNEYIIYALAKQQEENGLAEFRLIYSGEVLKAIAGDDFRVVYSAMWTDH